MQRWARRTVKIVGGTLVVLVLLVASALVATQTSWFRNWARGFGERQAARLLNGQLNIGRLDGNLWSGATLTNVRITQDGREVVRVERVRVTYSVRQLLSRHWRFPEITLTRPSIVLIHDAAGWHIANLLRPRRTDSAQAQPVELPSLTVEQGSVLIEDAAATAGGPRWPARIGGLDGDFGVTLARGLTDLVIRRATFEAAQPALRVAELSGHWTAQNGRHTIEKLHLRTATSTLDTTVSYQPAAAGQPAAIVVHAVPAPLDFAEFAELVPALEGRPLVLSGTVDASGPLDALAVKARVADPQAGGIDADVSLRLTDTAKRITGQVTTTRLDLAPILKDRALASRLTSTDRIDLTFNGAWSFDTLAGTVGLQSSGSTIWGYRWDAVRGNVRIARRTLTIDGAVQGYAARATAKGTIEPTAKPVRYALAGRLDGVDVRRLPPQLNLPRLESRISGTYAVSGAGSRLDASAIFDASTVEGTGVGAGSTGRFSNLDNVLRYGFSGHVDKADVQRWGRALDVQAIQADDYASSFTGRLMADGSGSSLDALVLDASAQLEPSTAFAATFGPADVTAHIANKTLNATYKGTAGGFDVARATGRSDLAGTVSGMVDVQTTLAGLGEPFDLGRLSARGTVSLDPSTIGPLALDAARLEGSLANRVADITAFEAMGPRLSAMASGRLALGDSGQSNLKYNASMTRLSDIGPLVGRMLDGRVLVDGSVTGNRADLVSTGTAAFSGLAVDDSFDALTLNASIEAHLPGLDVRALRADVKADGTLVRVAGREIPQLQATVKYADDRYRFEATANESGRTITASGDLVLLEGGREVTINRASLVTGPATWTLPETAPVRVRYQNGLITLPEAVTFVNNGQELSAQGTFAMTDDVTGQLDVTVSGVNLTELGALLLSPRQLAGTITGDARISGDPATRNIVGNIKLLAGIVDGYAFQSLDTLVNYRNGRAEVAAILIQSPTSRLDATGSIPFSLTKGVLTDQPMTVDVTSAGIDLAVLEAANTGLVNAAGLLVIDAHVKGTGENPQASGLVRVQQGDFTVASTGVHYSNVSVDATLEGQALQITKLLVHDAEGDALQGTGRLQLENRALRDIEFVVTGNDFTVLDNELGKVAVDASLNLYGTISAPKVAGLVRLHSARLEVDQIAERFGSSPYEPETRPNGAAAKPAAKEETSLPLGLNLSIQVPDNLILRGRDIRTNASAAALGDVNLTAGGDFTLRREGSEPPVLIGTITTVRGTYDFQGRRFQVLRDGSITFRGDTPVDPALNVTAERVISGIVAHVTVGGTMRDPTVTLSSQPPLDQTDILSLIVFNQPANRLGQGQATNLGERAAQIAGGFVASPIADTLGRALNVDIFELDPSGDEGEGPTVTIGQQVGERLFVKFRQLFGTRDVSEFQLEYQLTDFLRLQGSIAEGQTSANRSLTRRVERGGIDLVVYFSY
ncbi:MAG TPA: translocation/assembly module TamB domain-containing protein [Vicinamibacterales bacterium]|jgi:autotransporter translocation and assembly factor TamB|nr:translocation/assembly module TamB domain-containing protein [Vicinamibacterales bacterium]